MSATDCIDWSDPAWLGSANAETATKAYEFALEIAVNHEQRVHLRPCGRGGAGQLMWDVTTEHGLPPDAMRSIP